MTTLHNISFELYLNVRTVINSPCWLNFDRYRLLITVGGDSQTVTSFTISLTYKVLTTSQPDYLHNLISVQSSGRTRSSSVVTLARPSVSSSLQITHRSFRYASPHLWNQLPSSFRQPHCVHSPPGSPNPTYITSSQSSPSLSPSVTPSTFNSRLKTHLFHKSFPP